MDRIGMIGMSWRNGGTEALARFTVPAAERPHWLTSFAQRIGAEELVYLATLENHSLA